MSKRIKGSKRGLTFTLSDDSRIGSRFRYIINKSANEILILSDERGTGTVSRKRCGSSYKPLYDLRSKEIKEAVSAASYMEVTDNGDQILVHLYKEVKTDICHRDKVIRIEDILASYSGSIIIDRASFTGTDGYAFGRPTLANDEYFSYLQQSYQSSSGRTWKIRKEEKCLKDVYDVVSLFSGAGLLDYAFRDPQFRFVYAVDFDQQACVTYKENIGNHIHTLDIRNVAAAEVPHADLIIGGPCCQGYSNANRRNAESYVAKEKRLLIDDYVRIVKEKHPKVFVIENVPQLLTKEDGLYVSRVIQGLPDYEITSQIIRDCDVGGYTIRKRAIVIGSRIGKICIPDHKVHSYHTVRDALSKVDAAWFNFSDVTLPKESTTLTMSYVKPGGNWRDVPEEIHKFGPSTQSSVYRRLAWNEVAPTIANWRKSIIIHPDENRILTVSEAAALMGLDKGFRFFGSLASKQQQVANGVTQAIGRFVKKYVLDALNQSKKILAYA